MEISIIDSCIVRERECRVELFCANLQNVCMYAYKQHVCAVVPETGYGGVKGQEHTAAGQSRSKFIFSCDMMKYLYMYHLAGHAINWEAEES